MNGESQDQSSSLQVAKTEPAELALGQFQRFSTTLVETMSGVADLADQRLSTFLLSLGTVILFVGLAWKLSLLGLSVSTLEPSEFVALLLLSGFVIGLGSFFRWQGEKLVRETAEAMRAAGLQTLQETQRAANKAAFETPERTKHGL